MPAKNPVAEAVSLYENLELVQARLEQASPDGRHLFEIAEKNGQEQLAGLLADKKVGDALAAELAEVELVDVELGFLRETGLVDLAEKEAELAARKTSPLFRLAQYHLGGLAVTAEAASDGLTQLRSMTITKAADEVLDKDIRVKGQKATITEVLIQDATVNAGKLEEPIFGKNRAGVYIPKVRGGFMLFLGVGRPSDCLRIIGAEVNGQRLKTAGKICSVLGLDSPMVGDLAYDGKTLAVSKLRSYPQFKS